MLSEAFCAHVVQYVGVCYLPCVPVHGLLTVHMLTVRDERQSMHVLPFEHIRTYGALDCRRKGKCLATNPIPLLREEMKCAFLYCTMQTVTR